MDWIDHRLQDGGRLSLLANEDGVYAALDGDIIAGPMATQLARVRVEIPLPDDRGNAGVKIDYDGAFVVEHNGVPIERVGDKTKRIAGSVPKEVRTGMKALWVLAAINLVVGVIAHLNPSMALDPFALWMVGAVFAGLASWAMTGPHQAAIPFGLAIAFLVVDSLWMLKNGVVGGVILRAFLVKWLFDGIKAARQDNQARKREKASV